MADDLTPAGELREAARQIRELVAGVPRDWRLAGSQIVAAGNSVNVIATCMVPERAAYVASMHPLVVLAVADWLESIADDLDDVPAGAFMAYSPDPALKVAREYLGTREDTDG